MGAWEFKNDTQKIWVDGSGKTVGEILGEAASQSGIYFWSISRSNLAGRCNIGINLW